MTSPRLAVVIVSWNVQDLLRRCLSSLLKSSLPANSFDIWVVDNASADGSADMVKKEFPMVHLIANTENLGFAKANNQALQQISAPVTLILNPDTAVEPTTLEELVRVLDQYPKAGIVCPQIRFPNGDLQPSIRCFPTAWALTAMLLKLTHVFPWLPGFSQYLGRDIDYTREQQIQQGMGAAFLIRKEVFDRIGFLDEGYWIWMEEVDFMKRAVSAGFEIWYTPRARIVHHHGQSFSQVKLLTNARRMSKSVRRYAWKHLSFFSYLWISALAPVHIGLTWLYSKVRRHI